MGTAIKKAEEDMQTTDDERVRNNHSGTEHPPDSPGPAGLGLCFPLTR